MAIRHRCAYAAGTPKRNTSSKPSAHTSAAPEVISTVVVRHNAKATHATRLSTSQTGGINTPSQVIGSDSFAAEARTKNVSRRMVGADKRPIPANCESTSQIAIPQRCATGEIHSCLSCYTRVYGASTMRHYIVCGIAMRCPRSQQKHQQQ